MSLPELLLLGYHLYTEPNPWGGRGRTGLGVRKGALTPLNKAPCRMEPKAGRAWARRRHRDLAGTRLNTDFCKAGIDFYHFSGGLLQRRREEKAVGSPAAVNPEGLMC